MSCSSQAPSGSESSTPSSVCRRNYLTADDLDPSEMFKDPLPIPNRLTANYTDPDDPAGTPVWAVHARAYTWRPADGVCIDKWGFEGTTPGPTLVAAPGEPSQLVVYNELPDNLYNPYFDPFNQLAWQQAVAPNRTRYTSFGTAPVEPPAPYDEPPYAQTQYELSPDLSIHLHGGHQTPENDGHPMDTFGPGHSHVYDYPNDQEATTLWYHDHAMDHTRGHVLNGLAGFYLVEDRRGRHRARTADRRGLHVRAVVRHDAHVDAAVLADARPGARRSADADRVRRHPDHVPAGAGGDALRHAVPTDRYRHAGPAEPAVRGGVDGQRHAVAVPHGDQQAVPLPIPQRQRRGADADLDEHLRRPIRRATRRTRTCNRSARTAG